MHHGSGSIAPPRTTLWRGWMLVVGLVFFVVGAAAGGAKQAPSGGCQHPAAISVSLGAGEKTGKESKVLDSNLGSEWIAWGKGESMWLELASPTVIDAVAIAFRKGDKLIHTFDIFLVDTDNNVKLVYVGTSSGNTEGMQIFSLKDRAAEAVAIAIVGYGTDETGGQGVDAVPQGKVWGGKTKMCDEIEDEYRWKGFAEVELCARTDGVDGSTHEEKGHKDETGDSDDKSNKEEGSKEPAIGISSEGETGSSSATHGEAFGLAFRDDQKGFNVVNMCSFPVRIGATGSPAATCNAGTVTSPLDGECYWALPEGNRDLEPGEAALYVLPDIEVDHGSLIWAGNIWVSTGCVFSTSSKYDFPAVDNCVTNFCQGGTCPDYFGPGGVTTKAEFAMRDSGLDYYDVSIIDGANVPMEISPVDAVATANDHLCGNPGATHPTGELEPCSWTFDPSNVEGHHGDDLSPYTRVVWPADPDNPTSCTSDEQCQTAGEGYCGVLEERGHGGTTKTGALKPMVCGRPVGWMSAHTACGATGTGGSATFPDDYPFDCHLASKHGSYAQLYRCSGSVYGSQACYMTEAEDSCCGCPSWDESNGGCVSTNPEWTEVASPWATFFKKACPTSYSFPRDDRTSMFVCSNEGTDSTTDRNTQSYIITLCPGDSEARMFQ